MNETQYATIPINFLEIKSKIHIYQNLHLSKYTPYKSLNFNNIVVKIGDEKTPYIEEVITKNKIGLNKKDDYKVYIPGNIIYKLCTKEEAFKIVKKESYNEIINFIFKV